ncbi:hypothetical protein, partial [Janthinobacterium lividum]
MSMMKCAMQCAAAAALCATLSPAMAASAPAAPPFLDVLVYQYANCVKPSYHQAGLLVQDG